MIFALKQFDNRFPETTHGDCDGRETRLFHWKEKDEKVVCQFIVTSVNFKLIWDYKKYEDEHYIEVYKNIENPPMKLKGGPMPFKEYVRLRRLGVRRVVAYKY